MISRAHFPFPRLFRNLRRFALSFRPRFPQRKLEEPDFWYPDRFGFLKTVLKPSFVPPNADSVFFFFSFPFSRLFLLTPVCPLIIAAF